MRSAVARQPDSDLPTDTDGVDFALSQEEVAKGAQAVCTYLESIPADDVRKSAEEVLDMLALVISAGVCKSTEFPWHQLRAHHGTAAFGIMKQMGTPARIETYLCRKDQSRRSRRTPDSYPSSQVQKARHSLRRVLTACSDLGFVDPEEGHRTMELLKTTASGRVVRGRGITDGEFRALISICEREVSPAGLRDALLFRLGYQGGLRLSELVAVSIEDLHFDMETNTVALEVRGGKNVPTRHVPIGNQALITVEDWLEACEADEGPLLRPVKRGKVEARRMKGADVRLACERRSEQAGVELFSPQDLRRRVAAGQPAELYGLANTAPTGFLGEILQAEREIPATLAFPYPGRNAHNA